MPVETTLECVRNLISGIDAVITLCMSGDVACYYVYYNDGTWSFASTLAEARHDAAYTDTQD